MEEALDTELRATRARLDDYIEHGSNGLPAAHEAVLLHELAVAHRTVPFSRTTRRKPVASLDFPEGVDVDMSCPRPIKIITEEMREVTRSTAFNSLSFSIEQLKLHWFIMFQVLLTPPCNDRPLVLLRYCY